MTPTSNHKARNDRSPPPEPRRPKPRPPAPPPPEPADQNPAHQYPADLSIPEAASAFRAGTLTARQLTEATLARIATLNPKLHAFTTLNPQALQEADHADALLASGPQPLLCGIPVGVKDLIDVANLPATCGSAVLTGRIAQTDASAVANLRAQGAVIMGKLATYEFAMVGPDLTLPDPPARNPWNLGHVTGGSSSGSAAAVAAGLIRLALGTDTGGSIRAPAVNQHAKVTS